MNKKPDWIKRFDKQFIGKSTFTGKKIGTFTEKPELRLEVIDFISQLLLQTEDRVREEIKTDLYQLDWIRILKRAIDSRPRSWSDNPVLEFRNASDEVLAAMMDQAIDKGIFDDLFTSLQKGKEKK